MCMVNRVAPFSPKTETAIPETPPRHITKWNELLGYVPNWKSLISQLQNSAIPIKSRDVLTRIFHHNLQVRHRFHFLNRDPSDSWCHQCPLHVVETLEHCLFTCPHITTITSLLRLTYFNFYHSRLASHWDILFSSDPPKASAHPWIVLRAIAIHAIWSSRCQTVLSSKPPSPTHVIIQEILTSFETRVQGLYHSKTQARGPKAHKELVAFCQLYTETVPMFVLPSKLQFSFPTLAPHFAAIWGSHLRTHQ